ncbi:hypothetical protein AGMMS50267_09270 [Spirochaetia bacterium]|nr:hypothetical protein AGMMS50267_09270 [Spirochaetia bacterium]
MGQKLLFTMALLYAALVFSCTTTAFSAGEAQRIPEDYFGIAPYNGQRLDERDYAMLDDLGVVWMRRTFRWSGMEPESGRWNFEDYDAYVAGAKMAGKKVLAILAYDPGWLYENGREYYIGPDKLPQYLAFVEQVVRHYQGQIDAYEIWNEPNGIFWKGPRKDFFALTKAAAAKIREVDSSAVIVGGSVWRADGGFTRGLFRSGAMKQADIISFHPYAITPHGSIRLYDRFVRIVRAQGFSGAIWVTEVGFPTAGWYPTRVSADNYPAYIVKTLAGLAVRGNPVSFWYELFDRYTPGEQPSKRNSENYFGIAYPDYSYKKGAAAYRLCAHLLAGKTYRPELPERTNLPAAVEALYFQGDDAQNALLLWTEGRPRRVKVSLPGTGQRLYDIAAGMYEAIGEDLPLVIDRTPRIFTWTASDTNTPATVVSLR